MNALVSKVSAALEKFNGTKIGRIEYMGTPSELESYVKESNGYFNHITEIDEQSYAMSDGKEGELCIAFQDGQDVLLLRELFEKYPIWSPDSVFNKESTMFSTSEKKRLMLKTYYEGCPYGAKNAILCRFIWKDDMDEDLCWRPDCGKEAYGAYFYGESEDETTFMCEYHKKKLHICDDCHHTPEWCDCDEDADEIVSAPSIMAESNPVCVLCKKLCDCKYGNNPQPLASEGVCCNECNQKVILARVEKAQEVIDTYTSFAKKGDAADGFNTYERNPPLTTKAQDESVKILIQAGMMKINEDGEYEMTPWKPQFGRVGGRED
jgi:hypothetical protein